MGMRRDVTSIIISVLVVLIGVLVAAYLEVKMITPQNSILLLYVALAAVFFIIGTLIWGYWPTIHPSVPANTIKCAYTEEQLNQGADVYVPPAAAVEFPIELKKGETIQIRINSVESQTVPEHYIDSMVLDRCRHKLPGGWDRSTSRGYIISIPVHKSPKPKGQPKIHEGRHMLRLSNEYQTMLEKQVRIKISRQPYLESINVIIIIGTIRWS
jgi:hypothetical protein